MATIPIEVDMRTFGTLLPEFVPIDYVLAVAGEHAETTEILPGIAVELEPLWMFTKRMIGLEIV